MKKLSRREFPDKSVMADYDEDKMTQVPVGQGIIDS